MYLNDVHTRIALDALLIAHSLPSLQPRNARRNKTTGNHRFCTSKTMSALAAAAPDLPLTLFDDDSTASSLTKLRAGKPLIIDFWTTRCERCPGAVWKSTSSPTPSSRRSHV